MSETPDINRFVENAYARESARWAELQDLNTLGHPKEAEFVAKSAKAENMLLRMRALQSLPKSYPVLKSLAEDINKLYEEVRDIRNEITNDTIAKSWGIPPSSDLESAMTADVETVLGKLGNFDEKLLPNFTQVLRTLSMDPFEDQMTFMSNVQESRKILREAQKKAAAAPKIASELVALEQRLQAALDKKITANPTIARGVAHKDWYEETFTEKRIDAKPLRVMGGLIGALITTLGLAQTVFSKNHNLSPATLGWGMATMLMINPNLFSKNSGNSALDFIASLGTQNINDLVDKGFKGPEGKKAFEELQEYRKTTSGKTILEALQKPDRKILLGDLTELTENDVATPLYKILSAMSEEDRKKALTIFGRKMTRDEEEFMGMMLENRT